jgi:hypothetical protein
MNVMQARYGNKRQSVNEIHFIQNDNLSLVGRSYKLAVLRSSCENKFHEVHNSFFAMHLRRTVLSCK